MPRTWPKHILISPRKVARIKHDLAAGMTPLKVGRAHGIGVQIVYEIQSGEYDARMNLEREGIKPGTAARCGCGRLVRDDGHVHCAHCRTLKQRPAGWMPRPGDDPNLRLELDADAAARLAEIQGGQVEFINRKRVRRIA